MIRIYFGEKIATVGMYLLLIGFAVAFGRVKSRNIMDRICKAFPR